MTITRLGQLTAELRITSDIDLAPRNTVPTISAVQVHTGSYAYLMAATPGAFGLLMPTPQSAVRCGFYLWHSGFGTSDTKTFLWMAANGRADYESALMGLRIKPSTSEVEAVIPVSGTSNSMQVLATATMPAALLANNVWIHIGVTFKCAALDGFLTLYVNGEELLSYQGDTRMFGQGNGSNFYSTDINFVWGTGIWNSGDTSVNAMSATCYIDDFFVDGYAGELDAPVPGRRFLFALPDGNGADSDWTGSDGNQTDNYLLVDENPNTGDTDYVKAQAAALKDTYTFGNVTLPADYQIVQVLPTVVARRLDSGIASQVRVHAYDGLNYGSSDDLDLPMNYSTPVFGVLATQPDGSPWNETDFNAMQFGIESRGTF